MPQDASPGAVIRGRYHILPIILGCGSSKVYLAIDQRNRRPAACKAIRLRGAGMEGWIFHEIRILNEISHPNIIKLYDTAHDDDYIFLFFKPYDASLRQYIDTHIQLDESETKCIMWQILQGIRYLHSLDISHCDLKLENILLQFAWPYPYPAVCIADFEMALYENKTKHDYPGVCGTISYLPPEAIRALDNRGLTYRRKRADRWSTGVILFILLSGFHPFHCIYLQSTKVKILAGLIDFQCWSALTAGNNLVSILCHPHPRLRATAEQALQHVWFHNIGALMGDFLQDT